MSITNNIGVNWRNQTNQDLVLLDEEFLATLSEQKDRQIYARIIALDINENPVDQIEGRVTGGSINVDGNSTVRRTCSLTLICDQIDINDFYWGIKTKFKLFIGLQNNLVGEYAYTEYGKYPQIVWFPQGTYVVATFNTSISTNNCTISISGKDKMSLLNGDLGGSLFASIDFGTEEVETKIMNPVGMLDDTSSETLMAREYYFQPDESPDIILAVDTQYVFVLNDYSGTYAKDGNLYKKVTPEYDENNLRIPDGYKHYDIYQQVNKPEDLFDNIGTEYQTGVFYKKQYGSSMNGNSDYYLLAKTSMGNNIDYFSLKTLYTLAYETTIKHIPIEKIIRESVHAYANEPYYNIVINDLEDYGLEQLTYRGNKVLFAIRNANTGHFINIMFAENFQNSYNSTLDWTWNFNDDKSDIESIVIDKNTKETFDFDSLSSENTSVSGTILRLQDRQYNVYTGPVDNYCRTIAKIVYGDDLGYRLTDLTYPGDLISSIGENLTSILDKIKNMLGDFEYFYDLDGKFIFQRKQTYVNTSWSQLTESEDETYVTYGNDKKKFSFNFEGNRLISSFQNSPVLNNLRNDFVVWGKRKSISGAEIPIHARYAIDKKPVYYKSLSNEIYTTDIEYAYEQIPDFQPKTQASISQEIRNRLEVLQNFDLEYPVSLYHPEFNLAEPVRNGQYKWEPGWWDIRDWARYYKLVTTGNENSTDPNGTMKFYSSNDAYGCVPVNKLLEDGVPLGLSPYYNNAHVWLLEIRKNGSINAGHGIGTYSESVTRESTYYTSEYVNGVLKTVPTDEKQQFHYPYWGCSDSHTYLYFLDKINSDIDDTVYFYNPKFPFGESEEEIIASDIAKDYANDVKKYHIHIVDWREIIYQMALDFFAGQGCSEKNPIYTWIDKENGELGEREPQLCCTDPDHFLYEVGSRNPYYYPTGYTGYEQYYTDMEGFWRQLYNPEYVPQAIYSKGEYQTQPKKLENSVYWIKEKSWKNAQLTNLNIDYYFCQTDKHIQTFYNQTQELSSQTTDEDIQSMQILYSKYAINNVDFIGQTDRGKRAYWNKNVFESPETLNFWIDFLDSDTELASFSVKSVGDRTKVINEDKAGAIFYKEIPGLILYDLNESTRDDDGEITVDTSKLRSQITENSGYVFVYLPKGFSQYLTISYRGTSVKDKIDELLYQFSYCIENVSITSIPIYYLQPNTRIYVQDKNTGVEGEYIVSKITIPLTYNGTMSISAFKAPERLY